jgi:Glycosyl hydrolase family 1
MPWSIAFTGYAAGAFPPCRTSFSDFLKAAHTLALAQAEAHRALKAASPKATVGSAYEMAPALSQNRLRRGSRSSCLISRLGGLDSSHDNWLLSCLADRCWLDLEYIDRGSQFSANKVEVPGPSMGQFCGKFGCVFSAEFGRRAEIN